MSYILDALRRADAERDRGNVPGIHAQGYGAPMPTVAPPAPRPWAWLVAGAVSVMAVGGAAWYLAGRSSADAPGSVAVVPAAGTPAAAVTPALAAPAPAPALPPVAAVAPPPPATPPAPATVAAAKPRPEVPSAARNPKPAAAAASATEPSAARPSATAEKVYALAELPDEIRRQLPTLSVGGSMYSSKPADRLLILNGQVAHEGDRIANDLVLQQIRLKSALLNFKGYHYVLNF